MNFFQTLGGTPTGGRGFGGGRGGGVGTPTPAFTREEVRAIFYPSRVVTLMMPYQTPRAANIRAFCAARLLNENNQRLFIFRSNVPQNMFWTNVALASTPANPVLTAEPSEIARKLSTILAGCPDVSGVVLQDENNAVLTAEQIDTMAFTPLEESAAAAPEPAANADISVAELAQLMRDVYSKVEEVSADNKRDIVQLKSMVDGKLGYIIDVLEGKARAVDPARRMVPRLPQQQEAIPLEDDNDHDGDDETMGEAGNGLPAGGNEAGSSRPSATDPAAPSTPTTNAAAKRYRRPRRIA